MKIRYCHFKTLLRTACMLMLCTAIGCVNVGSHEEQNKAAYRRMIDEIYDKGNIAVLDEVYAENLIFHYNEKTVETLEIARGIRMLSSKFRNIKFTIDDMIAEGDTVAVRTTFQGIYRRNGKNITLWGITIARFKNGKIIEAWRVDDKASMFRQLGISPPPTTKR